MNKQKTLGDNAPLNEAMSKVCKLAAGVPQFKAAVVLVMDENGTSIQTTGCSCYMCMGRIFSAVAKALEDGSAALSDQVH